MAKFELYKDSSNLYRWRLLDADNRVIAESGEGYRYKGACESGIDLVKLFAPQAQVEDQTQPPAPAQASPHS